MRTHSQIHARIIRWFTALYSVSSIPVCCLAINLQRQIVWQIGIFFFICLLCLNTSLLTPTHTHKNTYLGIFGSFIHFFFYSLFLFDDKFIQMRYKCLVCNGWTSNNSLLCVWWNEHCAAMKRLRISSVSSVTAIFVCVSVLKFTKGWIETNVPMKYFFYAFKTFVFVKPG